MAEENVMQGDLRVTGQARFGSIVLPINSVSAAQIPAGAGIEAEKVEHQHAIHLTQASGAAVVSETRNVHIARGAGEVIGLSAMVDTAPTGADRTITIDVQKGNQATGFATLVTATAVINNATVARQVKTATLIVSPTYAAGDTLRIIVTVAGAAGVQGQGLCVTLMTHENAEP